MKDYHPWEEPSFEGLRGVVGRAIKYPLLNYEPKSKYGVSFSSEEHRKIIERQLERMELAIEEGHPITSYDEDIVELQRGLMKKSPKGFIKATNRLEELLMERSRELERKAPSGIIDDRHIPPHIEEIKERQQSYVDGLWKRLRDGEYGEGHEDFKSSAELISGINRESLRLHRLREATARSSRFDNNTFPI